MKKFIVLATVLFASSAVFAQHADDIKGVWINKDKDAKIEIYKSGDTYYGKISWMKEMYEADGKTLKKDVRNANEKERNRTIINLNILSGFRFDEGEWTGGELYDPKSGKTYKSKMKLRNGSLEIRGYVGSPMFGKTTIWTKV
jgi:uncharacterized protein (DUF2147 family)